MSAEGDVLSPATEGKPPAQDPATEVRSIRDSFSVQGRFTFLSAPRLDS
jgi:hypothetical protein